MSKELEALKEIRSCLYGDVYVGVKRKLDLIETALIILNMYENVVGIERIQDTNKKLKALEILRKIIACEGDEEFPPYQENDIVSKEEYDLLKEVLL